eukprot:3919530-Rhodomonas_salina.1
MEMKQEKVSLPISSYALCAVLSYMMLRKGSSYAPATRRPVLTEICCYAQEIVREIKKLTADKDK